MVVCTIDYFQSPTCIVQKLFIINHSRNLRGRIRYLLGEGSQGVGPSPPGLGPDPRLDVVQSLVRRRGPIV